MEQESISKTVAIIGAGPAGCICAKYLSDFGFDVSVFDKGEYLQTLLPTGGGRCNLAHAIYDYKELAENYPRGEKFLYSLFSRFATPQTLNFFNSIGIQTYTQKDLRIFPKSNSAAEVRLKLLKSINCKFIHEKVTEISPGFKITTNKAQYCFDYVVVAIGGHSDFDLIKNLGINIVEPTQSLVGLVTKEDFSQLAGVSVSNVEINNIRGDILFTHKGISGPLIYKISSIKARDKMPYNLSIKLTDEIDLQQHLNKNPHKEIKNLLGQFIPKSLSEFILNLAQINPETKCCNINGKMRDKIKNLLTDFNITVSSKFPDGEVVTCGGVDLKEINPKTLESKKIKNLYFCGEVLDIDGFCGGFNLQNCWSSGFITADSIKNLISI